MNWETKYWLGGSALISLGCVAAIVYGISWYFKPADIPPGVTVEATPAPEIRKVEKIEIKPVAVKVYKPKAKADLKLPKTVTDDPYQHVIASSLTANDERQHTVTTVIDEQTGEATTFDRVEPLPWLSVNTKTMIGAYAGLKNGEQAIRVMAQQELIQIKALHVGAVVSADMTRSLGTDTFVGIGAWARW